MADGNIIAIIMTLHMSAAAMRSAEFQGIMGGMAIPVPVSIVAVRCQTSNQASAVSP